MKSSQVKYGKQVCPSWGRPELKLEVCVRPKGINTQVFTIKQNVKRKPKK